MVKVDVRQATAADIPVVYDYMCGLVERQLDRAVFEQQFTQCISVPRYHYIVACIGDTAVGFLGCHGQMALHYAGYAYEILQLYIHPEHRGVGIGKQLLQAIEDIVRKEEGVMLYLSSNKRRTDAHRFYIANGFEQSSYKFKKEIS